MQGLLLTGYRGSPVEIGGIDSRHSPPGGANAESDLIGVDV